MRVRQSFVAFFSVVLMQGCSSQSTKSSNDYALLTPDQVYELPEKLREVSGIAWVNDSMLACVEDEHGKIYLYNLTQEKIVNEISFHPKGDFEDVSLRNDTAYVLKSNGVITEVASFSSTATVRHFELKLGDNDEVEGLFYQSGKLLIASKEQNRIYTFYLAQASLVGEPIQIKTTFEFAPSAIAVHPISGELYILSSAGNRLIITTNDGEVLHVHKLPKTIFAQPEGLTFSPSGDLFISNEGKDGKGNVVMFRFLR